MKSESEFCFNVKRCSLYHQRGEMKNDNVNEFQLDEREYFMLFLLKYFTLMANIAPMLSEYYWSPVLQTGDL